MFKQFQDWAFTIEPSESILRRSLKTTTRIILILVHIFFSTNISLRASALTYSIILSLVPILAMSTAILKGLGSDNDLKIAAYRLIDQLDPIDVQTDTIVEDKAKGKVKEKDSDNAGPSDDSATMSAHLRNGVNMVFDYADRTNFTALGAFGIVGLLFVVLIMFNNIEMTMNAIWQSKKSRPLGRKIMDYLALIVLLPISFNVAFAGDTIVQSQKILVYINTIIPSAWLVKMLFKGLPFLFIVGSLTFMYQFFPYARVKTYAAFIGALFSALCWFAVQQVYIMLQIGVSRYNAIYGSFATVPLFLIWLHLGWIFLLLGAALAYAVQNRNRHIVEAEETYSPQRRLQLAFDILQIVYTDFEQQQATTIKRLQEQLVREPMRELETMSKSLIANGLVKRVAGKDDLTITPSQPKEQCTAEDLTAVVFGCSELATQGGRFANAVLRNGAAQVPMPIFSTAAIGGTVDAGQ